MPSNLELTDVGLDELTELISDMATKNAPPKPGAPPQENWLKRNGYWFWPTMALTLGSGFVFSFFQWFFIDLLDHRVDARIDAKLSEPTKDIQQIKLDVGKVSAKLDMLTEFIKPLIAQKLKAIASLPAAEFKENLGDVAPVLVMAKETRATLDRQNLLTVAMRLRNLAADPNLSSVAWSTLASLLNYTSAVTVPPSIQWLGPAFPPVNGFQGLLGQTEMKDVQEFASSKQVALRRGSVLVTLASEDAAYRSAEQAGIELWPEFEMIVGANDSNVVLDNLHARNVVFKHINIVYGGGKTLLENVTFIDCKFALVKTPGTLQLSDLLIRAHAPITFGT